MLLSDSHGLFTGMVSNPSRKTLPPMPQVIAAAVHSLQVEAPVSTKVLTPCCNERG